MVIPAFVITELKEAFIIGFLIFLPFLVLDMLIANVLLALGMQTLSPEPGEPALQDPPLRRRRRVVAARARPHPRVPVTP